MKHVHAVRGTPKSGVSEGVRAGFAQGPGDGADSQRTQAHSPAERHGFVVGWELKDWLASEQDWFPK